jgi:carbamoyl-phosphate synthase large subunit
MRQADGIIVIRTALSESTAFEISYNIFGGSRVPIFFAVSDKSPIKTTLLKDLDDYIEVKYHTFTDPNELLIPLGDFVNDLAIKKEDNERMNKLKNRNFVPKSTHSEGTSPSMFL